MSVPRPALGSSGWPVVAGDAAPKPAADPFPENFEPNWPFAHPSGFAFRTLGMGDSRRVVGRQYVQYLERLCLVRLVGFASSRALDRQYVETPFRPAILTKCASFRGWRSIR
jgi:hypothetical protein